MGQSRTAQMCLLLEKEIETFMKNQENTNEYIKDLRLTKSLAIVSSLQKRKDLIAKEVIEKYDKKLNFNPSKKYLIEKDAWNYISNLKIKPQLVFCHPDLLFEFPIVSLYYRGMAGLSIKAAKDYMGSIEALEAGSKKIRLTNDKVLKMSRTYNIFLSSIILNSTNWTLENGLRTIIATMGISLDGTIRNKIGDIGEDRVRRLVLQWLLEKDLILNPKFNSDDLPDILPRTYNLVQDIEMNFSSEPDISFLKDNQLVATIEIKGGIDPAGALERYGAAKKSFEHAVSASGRSRNFYLGGVFTEELQRRINSDRLVEKTYNMIMILNERDIREDFFRELFHHTLRII
jgi:hypothetical protein